MGFVIVRARVSDRTLLDLSGARGQFRSKIERLQVSGGL